MIKQLTMPIQIIHFMVLAFLMTLSAPIAAQDFQKGLTAAVAGDYATALQEWRPLAEAGNMTAQLNLGIMYYKGEGVPQDYKESAKWYRLAADQGGAQAQHNLALKYYDGEGVLQDYQEAAK
tara:strand:+ start:119 stop:484 length:366 start_codon:yes stop_codon:yes gene_type:complete